MVARRRSYRQLGKSCLAEHGPSELFALQVQLNVTRPVQRKLEELKAKSPLKQALASCLIAFDGTEPQVMPATSSNASATLKH